jgi:hypothetical protein
MKKRKTNKLVDELWYISSENIYYYNNNKIDWGEIEPYLTFKMKYETIDHPSNLEDCIRLINKEINSREE